ncbi:MAG: HDOD domain-containing protein [Tepidisphaeraceae bacterium]
MIATPPTPKELLDHALGQLTMLATLPEITSQIIATVEDPRSSASQLHKIVSHDPVLVSRVLKVVNSAFYGLPGQVNSVDRAIVLLGLNAVKNIALAASLGQLFRGAKLCEGYSAKDLWKHCLAVAVVAKELAKRAKKPFVEEAFLAGMVHDLGLLVTLQTWPEKLQNVCDEVRKTGRPFVEVEREFVGVDHQRLGEGLATRWKFPRVCAQVAGHHHDQRANPDDIAAVMATVTLADTICCQAAMGFPLTAAHQVVSDELIRKAESTRAILDGVTADIAKIVDSASALLG